MSASGTFNEFEPVEGLRQIHAHITAALVVKAETNRTHSAWAAEPLLDRFSLRCVAEVDDEVLDAGAVEIPLDRTFRRRAHAELFQRSDSHVSRHLARLKRTLIKTEPERVIAKPESLLQVAAKRSLVFSDVIVVGPDDHPRAWFLCVYDPCDVLGHVQVSHVATGV